MGVKMSWQAEYEKKYREQLEREWTVEGERIPFNRVTQQDRDGLTQLKQFIDEMPTISDDLWAINDKFMHIRLENTREICGND
jgi:hypothetical protein